MSKLHLKRWWSKAVDFSWSEMARKEFNYAYAGMTEKEAIELLISKPRNQLIKNRIAKRIGKEHGRIRGQSPKTRPGARTNVRLKNFQNPLDISPLL